MINTVELATDAKEAVDNWGKINSEYIKPDRLALMEASKTEMLEWASLNRRKCAAPNFTTYPASKDSFVRLCALTWNLEMTKVGERYMYNADGKDCKLSDKTRQLTMVFCGDGRVVVTFVYCYNSGEKLHLAGNDRITGIATTTRVLNEFNVSLLPKYNTDKEPI